MKNIYGVIILLLFSQSILTAQEEKMRLAIMDLQAIGVSLDTAKTVSDLLRTELFKTKLFRVLERAEMEKILQEQGLQQSGCTEIECAVQFGKILSAKKVLVGTVNKLGDSFIINARIVDVEKGEVDFAENTSVPSESDLLSGCKDFANKIAEDIKNSQGIQQTGQETFKQPAPNKAYLTPLRTIGFLSIGTCIVCGGLGYFFNTLAVKSYNDAGNLYNSYMSASSGLDTAWKAYSDKYDLSQTQALDRTILYIVSGTTGVFGIVTMFITKKPVNNTSLLILPDRVQLAYRF